MKLVTVGLLSILIFNGAVHGVNIPSLFTKNNGPPKLIVTIEDGSIEGAHYQSYDNRTYMAFLGIPYAKPPVGNLRFKDSEPIGKWNGVKVANQTTKCIQILPTFSTPTGILTGDEDCLHINVYVPGSKIPSNQNLDVIVFIHGGAFMFGSSESGGPAYLMDRDVILVTFNYRIGVFGFLSTGDENLPGNYGLKDQVLALKWVQRNIGYFGGNKNSVTLHGHTSGGASVHYHYLSPLSRGLFHRGISSSGNALNPWAFDNCPLESARTIANSFNCPTQTTLNMVECLKTQSARALTEATRKLRPWLFIPIAPFSVVIDNSSSNPFLTKHPYQILLEKNVYNVPWMSTRVNSEGVFNSRDFWVNDANMRELNNNWNFYAQYLLRYKCSVDASKIERVSKKIRNFYFTRNTVEERNILELIKLFNDRMFLNGIGIGEQLHSQASPLPVLSYSYNYVADKKTELHLSYSNIPSSKLGAIYSDDMMLTYSQGRINIEKLSRLDEKMKDFLLDLFTSYAKSGQPNINNWTPVCQTGCKTNDYLYIGWREGFKMMSVKNLGERRFWKKLPMKENAKF